MQILEAISYLPIFMYIHFIMAHNFVYMDTYPRTMHARHFFISIMCAPPGTITYNLYSYQINAVDGGDQERRVTSVKSNGRESTGNVASLEARSCFHRS